MKRFLLLTVSLTSFLATQAQPWSPEKVGSRKLEDIIAAQTATRKANDDKGEVLNGGKVRKEGKHYHFDRWVWHWQSHLDENGELASPVRNFEAWQRYQQSQRALPKAKTTNMSQWSFIGPSSSPGGYNGIGRINDVGFHPTDSNIFIVATAGGGAWRTVNGGQTWTCLTDHLPVLGTSDIDYNPLNPNTIFLCTGDKDASDTYSIGVLKSTDGGITWNTTGIQFKRSDLRLTNSLVINPLDTNSLTLATSVGIHKSHDGGQTWTQVANGHFKELLYNPADTNYMYAARSSSGAIWRSTNGGASWQQIIAIPNSSRVSIAATPADPTVVKAVFADASDGGLLGIYSSTDTGASFTKIFGDANDCGSNILSGSAILNANSCSGQGWYDLAIAISPLNPNHVYVGGINTYRSLDGGTNWSILNQWVMSSSLPGVKVVHADKHKLSFNPLMPDVLFECNDGGIYKSYGPNLWYDLSNGLQITQFYRIAGSDLASFVIAGSQDNGTKRVTFTGGSNELTGGDGMDCQIDYNDPNVFYTSSQYGNFRRTRNNGGNFTNISNNIPGDPTGAWVTPLILHPQDPSFLLVGYQHVFFSQNQGDSWTDISPNFPTSANITRLSMTPQDANRIYALMNAQVRYTRDFGNNWSILPLGYSGSITDILADPTDTTKLYVTFGGYGATKVAQYQFGTGWSKLQDSLPDVPVQCIAFDTANGTMYVGTDIGVFYRDPSMTSWAAYNSGLPAIEVTDISINYATNELWAATYGRGVWKSPKHTSATGVANLPLALNVITISPNPSKGVFTVATDNSSLKDQPVNIRIISHTGAVVANTTGKFDGSGKMQIDGSQLAKGTYVVEIQTRGAVAARAKVVML